MEIVKIAAIGIVGALIAIQLKEHKPEYAFFVGIATCLAILSIVVMDMQSFISQVSGIIESIGDGGGYIKILLKVVGITYICDLSSSICKDAGYTAIASQVEIFGKLSVLLSGMPIIFALLSAIQGFAP